MTQAKIPDCKNQRLIIVHDFGQISNFLIHKSSQKGAMELKLAPFCSS